MAKNIEPKLKKIGEYLKLEEDTVFIVPEYQRAYSWQTTHCDKLWSNIDEISNAEDVKDCYFFGTIIINCQDDDTKYSLIDGQQRTTTFLLLLKALLMQINTAIEKVPANDDDAATLLRGLKDRRRTIINILYQTDTEHIPETPKGDEDAIIYQNTNILKSYSINERHGEDFTAILRATDFGQAEQNAIKIPNKKLDNKYTNFFRNFKFFYEKAGKLSSPQLNNFAKTILEECEVIEIKSWKVEQAITMFNSLNADGLPLYDADIISAKMYAVAEANQEHEAFGELWGELKHNVDELDEDNIADIDSILMQRMYYERALNGDTVSETGSVNVTTPGLRRYYTEINHALISKPTELCETMIDLTNKWRQAMQCPAMQVLMRLNENSRLFMASFFLREKSLDSDELDLMARTFLRLFTILELVDTGYSSKNFKTFLFREQAKYVHGASVQEIKADFDKHIKDEEKWTRENICEEIKDYEGYALVYLNEYLFALENGKRFELGKKCDVEHIMPQGGSHHRQIRTDAGIKDDPEFENLVDKLGNKILLEEKINRSIGMEWFSEKVSTKLEDKTGYIDSKYPLANALVEKYRLANKPYWTKDDIEDATDKACNRMAKFIFEG